MQRQFAILAAVLLTLGAWGCGTQQTDTEAPGESACGACDAGKYCDETAQACVDKRSEGDACEADEQCLGALCADGVCASGAATADDCGESCPAGQRCHEGQCVECVHDSVCGGNQHCFEGACTETTAGLGDACTNGHCLGRAQCHNDVCVECVHDSTCSGGRTCSQQTFRCE